MEGSDAQAPLFTDKAKLYPGATFVVGYDTGVRLVNPDYYGGGEGMILQVGHPHTNSSSRPLHLRPYSTTKCILLLNGTFATNAWYDGRKQTATVERMFDTLLTPYIKL